MLPEHISRQLIINLIAFTRKNFEYFENNKKIVMVRYPNKEDNWRLGGFERNSIDYKKLLDEIELDNMYGEYHEQELTPICRTPKVILPQKPMFKKQMTTLENILPKASFVKMKQGFSDLDKKPIIKTNRKKPQFKKLPLNVKVNLGLQQEL